ncbi:hypothetical protein RB195_024414 [Necator americanus]|uniref:Exostosin GT47 domain-containing protein n=1 Tax=Necator americanus TaxID=51031 RepID=A0ABR1EN64_NECAM
MNEVKRAEEKAAIRDSRRPTTIRMVCEENRGSHISCCQCALPTANEVAVVYVGEENDVPLARSLAVFFIESNGTSLLNISDIDTKSDLLMYPLLFPNERGGWDTTKGARITQMKYYSYLFPVRDSFNPILHSGKFLQQFAVDA